LKANPDHLMPVGVGLRRAPGRLERAGKTVAIGGADDSAKANRDGTANSMQTGATPGSAPKQVVHVGRIKACHRSTRCYPFPAERGEEKRAPEF
jgi:hypothetical protein